jgi:hypothetical protein
MFFDVFVFLLVEILEDFGGPKCSPATMDILSPWHPELIVDVSTLRVAAASHG